MCQFWCKSVQNSSHAFQSSLGKQFCGTEQGNTELRGPCYTRHPHHPHPVLTRKRSGSHPHANSTSPAPQTTSLPGHAHRKAGALCTKCVPLIPTKNIPALCQPWAGSPRAHSSAAVWAVMGTERRAERGCCRLPLLELEATVSRGWCSVMRLPFQQQLSLCFSSLSCSCRRKIFLVSIQNFGLHGSRSDLCHLLGTCLPN